MTVLALALTLAVALAAPADADTPLAPATPPAAQPSPEAVETIRKLMDRELPPLEPRAFTTPGGISGRVEAAAAPEAKAGDEVEEISIPIGTSQPISCSAVPKRLDPAAALWRVTENAKQKVTIVAVQPVDVVAVEGSALVFAVAVYQLASEKGPMVGLLKLGVYVHDAHSVLCLHDEPGYKATFERIVKGLAASLRGGGEDGRAGARFSELSVMRVGELPIGFSERLVRKRDGGGRTAEEYSVQLVPRGPSDLVAVDGYSREEIDAKDLLEKGTFVHAANGDLDTQVTVTREKDGKTYAYDGKKEGKALAGKFKTKAGLSTEFWFARRLAGSAPLPRKPLAHEAYSYEANPVAPVLVSYAAVAGGARRVSMKMGPMQVEGDLDANGLFETGEMPVGQSKLVIRRIFSRGTP